MPMSKYDQLTPGFWKGCCAKAAPADKARPRHTAERIIGWSSKRSRPGHCREPPRSLDASVSTRLPGDSLPAGEIQLPPGFVDGNGHGIGQVEAAVAGAQRQAQALCRRQRSKQLAG